MKENRIPKKACEWQPVQRRERGRTRSEWSKEIKKKRYGEKRFRRTALESQEKVEDEMQKTDTVYRSSSYYYNNISLFA